VNGTARDERGGLREPGRASGGVPAPEDAPAVLRRLLDQALPRTRSRWFERHPETVPVAVVEDSLAVLRDALASPAGIGVDPEVLEPSAHIEVRKLLLDLLRGEALVLVAEAMNTPPEKGIDGLDTDASQLLSLLLRFEDVARAMDVTGDQAVDAGLSGPRARELLAEIGHDLRSPLTSVLFLSEVLSASPGIREDRHQRRQLGLIHSAAVTMITLVNNFMELARTGTSMEEESRPSPFSLADLLEGLLRTLRPLADEKGLRLEVQNTVAGPDRRMGYPVSLSRVLLNLGTNAIKFTEEGRVLVRASEPAPGLVEIQVVDTGPGMSPSQARSLEEVFEPSATGSGIHFSGSGLGLVIVRKLLRRMGSELRVESDPGSGTRAAFTIPLTGAG
jgi:signal transduction histidine kinase